jgi:hypothetical protein
MFGRLIALSVFVPLLIKADSDVEAIHEIATAHKEMPTTSSVNPTNATIASVSDARQLVSDAVKAKLAHNGTDWKAPAPDLSSLNINDDSLYVIIHVLKWKDASSDSTKAQEVDTQNWYVYNGSKNWRQEDFTARKRIFGSKNVWLLFVHLNAHKDYNYDIEYDLTLKDITPAPLGHFLSVVSLTAVRL